MYRNSNFIVILPKILALLWRPNLPNNSKSTRLIWVFIVLGSIWLWIVPKCCGRDIWCVLQAAECWELRVWLLCDSFVGILGNFQAVEFVGSSTTEPVYLKVLAFLTEGWSDLLLEIRFILPVFSWFFLYLLVNSLRNQSAHEKVIFCFGPATRIACVYFYKF